MNGAGMAAEMSLEDVRQILTLASKNVERLNALAKDGTIDDIAIYPSDDSTTIVTKTIDRAEEHTWDSDGTYKGGQGNWFEGGSLQQDPELSGTHSVSRSDGEAILRTIKRVLEVDISASGLADLTTPPGWKK